MQRFVKAAIEHRTCSTNGNPRRANKAHDQLMEVFQAIKMFPDNGKGFLETLLHHEQDEVSGWAATYMLPLDEKLALSTLDRMASGKGMTAFAAGMVLKLWKTGGLKLVNWPN